ncbi:hypothetical protein ACFL4O_00885 [bacterium]
MKKKYSFFSKILLTTIGFIYLTASAGAVEVIPVINAQILGAQYFFDSESGDFGGIANLDVIPAIKFSDELSLIPSYYGMYKGTKDAAELAGGDTLFQESMSHTVILKLIRDYGILKVKPKVSYRQELINETKDEEWGQGLFDFNKISGGIELEKELMSPFLRKLRLGYDFYRIKFPNYESLETKYGTELATTSGMGKDVLDFDTNEIYVQSEWGFFSKLFSKLYYYTAFKSFGDQYLITSEGTYNSGLREDTSNTLTLNFSLPVKRSVFGFDYVARSYSSTQDHYDATYLKYVKDYYDYDESFFSPSYTIRIGDSENPIQYYFSYSHTLRDYSGRFKQTNDGSYSTDLINITSNAFTVVTLRPITKNISFKASIYYEIQDSNMEYEQTYTYNYDIFTYFLGLSYQY